MKISHQHFRLTARRSVAVVLAFVLSGLVPLGLRPARALALSNDNLITDSELFDSTSMSATRVQRFLELKGSYLAHYTASDEGRSKRAADIIVDVGNDFDLSPKFFLVLLQKEQSLITDSSPSQNQLDYALGYGCPSTCSSTYKGFAKQLRSAGDRIHNGYLADLKARGFTISGWGPGIAKQTVDGILITPANFATAILYTYNPYVGVYGGGDPRYGGNSLFQKLWQEWFRRLHPDGSLLHVRGESGIWLIRNGKRSAFLSRAAFAANYDSSKVINVDRTEIENYPVGPPLRFPEPSLVQISTGGIYLIANNEKRAIASKEVFRSLGYNPEEVIRGVRTSELEAYTIGPKITEADVFPTGRLLQSKTSGAIVYVDRDNIRHAIHSKEILRSQFRGQRAQRVSDTLIHSLTEGDPVLFRDGELVASRIDRRVYFISNGQRRWIPDIEAFNQLGFKRRNIILTNDKSVQAHPLGETLTDVNAQ